MLKNLPIISIEFTQKQKYKFLIFPLLSFKYVIELECVIMISYSMQLDF